MLTSNKVHVYICQLPYVSYRLTLYLLFSGVFVATAYLWKMDMNLCAAKRSMATATGLKKRMCSA